jgi:hypothetical protein
VHSAIYRSISLDLSCKIEAIVIHKGPPFLVYIHKSWTLGKPYGINKSEVVIRNVLGGNNLGISWEHDGNTLGIRKKNKDQIREIF